MAHLLNTLDKIAVKKRVQELGLEKPLHLFCEANQSLYHRITPEDDETQDLQRLLGLLTKSHIEALSIVETHQSAMESMEENFQQHLGSQHPFSNHSLETLLLVTHIWIYLQGYLAMDFSLANDYADQTAMKVAPLLKQRQDAVRTELMKSFYQGQTNAPNRQASSNGLMAWLKNTFFS